MTMAERLAAGDVCTRCVVVGYPTMSVGEAARAMREFHVGCLVVVDEREEGRVPIGMLTDRDIVTSVVAKAMNADTVRVGDVMSAGLVTAREADSMLDVLALMRRKSVRRVPVTQDNNVLIGVITLDDVLRTVADEVQAMADAIGGQQPVEVMVRP